jgi:hypothetical protein
MLVKKKIYQIRWNEQNIFIPINYTHLIYTTNFNIYPRYSKHWNQLNGSFVMGVQVDFIYNTDNEMNYWCKY